MKYFEQDAGILNQFTSKLDQLTKLSAKELAQKVTTTGDPTEQEAFFELIISILKEAKSMQFSPTMGLDLIAANSAIDSLVTSFSRVQKLDAGSSENEKKNLVSETRDRFREFYPRLVALRGYGLTKSALQNAAKRISDAAAKCESELEAIDKRVEEIEKWYAEKILVFESSLQDLANEISKVQDLISKLGVATYASRFEEESKMHKEESITWLKWLAACAVIFLFASGFVLFVEYAQPHSGDGFISWFASAASRLVILSLPSIGLLLCMRNYAACRHNYIVNKHRQNALSTFDLFRAAASDDETKKAVLLQSLQAIFAQRDSGYLKTASDNQSSTQFIELINKTVRETPHS